MRWKTLIINSAEPDRYKFTSDIGRILDEIDVPYDIRQYSDIPDISKSNYNKIIISASPRGDDIVDAHQQYYGWIESTTRPVLGICAGHQIIGALFGSKLIRDEQSEAGLCYVKIDKQDPIFKGYDKQFSVIQNHNDSITLPEDFDLLGHSDRCEVQVMRHKSSPICTVQFHAERWNPALIQNFIDLYK